MRQPKSDRTSDYLDDIILAVGQIQKYAEGLDQTKFLEAEMAQDAIIRRLEVIGEAARRNMSIDPDFTRRYPGLELAAAYRMRNALAHGYDTVNLRTVWSTIDQVLPALKAEAIRIRQAGFERDVPV